MVDLLGRMGARTQVTDDAIAVSSDGALFAPGADMQLMPDAAMTLAAGACFAEGRSVLTGLRTLRVKETDRIVAIVRELAKVGVQSQVNPTTRYTSSSTVEGESPSLVVPAGGLDCSPSLPRVEFDTYDDHRMAMSLALIGLRRPNVYIRNPACVAKTYPAFWADLARLYEQP